MTVESDFKFGFKISKDSLIRTCIQKLHVLGIQLKVPDIFCEGLTIRTATRHHS
jgi:hypothetical protein